MNIFISHSSQDAKFGEALVDLLIGIGVSSNDIIFTSNDVYGIPNGSNIFDWLKEKIEEKPYVIYLLSPNYYKSVACLNEMGAAWIVENEHSLIFTPNFDLSSPEFLNGAIDPRQIGFYINNELRLNDFIDSIRKHFPISNKSSLISQKIQKFNQTISPLFEHKKLEPKDNLKYLKKKPVEIDSSTSIQLRSGNSNNEAISKFFNDLENNKLKDEEVLLAKYIVQTDRYKLLTGWQIGEELTRIKEWESINYLNDRLSSNYEKLLSRLEIKKLVKVSALTTHGNPKELKVEPELATELIENEELVTKLFKTVAMKNQDPLPF